MNKKKKLIKWLKRIADFYKSLLIYEEQVYSKALGDEAIDEDNTSYYVAQLIAITSIKEMYVKYMELPPLGMKEEKKLDKEKK